MNLWDILLIAGVGHRVFIIRFGICNRQRKKRMLWPAVVTARPAADVKNYR